ncbi:hypothetical protein OB947_03150 [Aeromonas bestiarum]|uniref:phage tail terminator protein n=1 Tax=Aeromonas bestiarum TaxID=105751 RepID=UPI00259EFA3C|nr:hypothetical protein [Aeromonas bestiarum]MDM5087911.1 hypothetical protein [Aeromonas bestiarum]
MSTHASTPPSELDYLAAGERLRELLLPLKAKGLKEVFVATDLDAVANLGQHTPAIHVIYQGERENDTTQSGRVSSFDQHQRGECRGLAWPHPAGRCWAGLR